MQHEIYERYFLCAAVCRYAKDADIVGRLSLITLFPTIYPAKYNV